MMPTPNTGESRDDFMSRCIPELTETEGREQEQAVAMCASFWSESRKQLELLSPPTNEQNMTAMDARQAVIDQGHKFSKEHAVYFQPAPDIEMACGGCTFYLGLDENDVGQCEVVNGGISWYGHSELYINAKLQSAFDEANQEAIQEAQSGEVEETMNKQRDEPKEHKTLPFIVTKIDADKGLVEHTVAVMGNVDLGFDRIHSGAFTKTISERMHKIRVLDSHNTDSVMCVIGKPVMMKEIGKDELPIEVKQAYPNADGALMASTQFLIDTPEGKGVFERIKAGAVDEYSIGYDPLDVDFTDEEIDDKKVTIRNLRTIKLWEYSPVVFAMNPATSTLSAKDDKGASGATDLPIADRDRAWDSDAAIAGIRDLTDSDDEPSTRYRRGFFWFDGENADQFGAYKLPFAASVDGDLAAIPRGIFAVAAALSGARGGVDIPESDLPAVRSRVARYYSRMREQFDDDNIVPPWEKTIDLIVSTKAENLTARVRDVIMAFYKTYPDDARDFWWVKEVWDDHIIVEQESIAGDKLWKTPYTIGDEGVTFPPQAEWIEVELIYQPKMGDVNFDIKVGRAISAANAARIQRAIDSAQSALSELESLLGIEQEEMSEHADDEEKSTDTPIEETDIEEKAVSDVDQDSDESDNQAGPDDEPPTSEDKDAILADIEQALYELEKLSEVEGK
jgi:HK97 family phage prohead protease